MDYRMPPGPDAPPRSNPQSPARLTPKTPIDRGRRPPRLVLPTPNATQINNLSPYPQSLMSSKSSISNGNPYPYPRKESEFVSGLRGFAKSGLSIGEKSTFWIYNKISSWSKKWFTHFFLSIVLSIYTIGGALVFKAVEGKGETSVKEEIRQTRYHLIAALRTMSIVLPNRTSDGEWEAKAALKLKDYEDAVIEAYKTAPLIYLNRDNDEDPLWSFSNAVMYCATIFTTIDPSILRHCKIKYLTFAVIIMQFHYRMIQITCNKWYDMPTRFAEFRSAVQRSNNSLSLEIMDTLQASAQSEDTLNVENVEKSAETEMSTAKLEAMVTPEQVLSASVARKRRSLSRKNLNRAREPTPGRDVVHETTSDEEAHEKRPKTPERKRRKNKISSVSAERTDSLKLLEKRNRDEEVLETSSIVSRESIPKQDEQKRKGSLVDITQQEVVALFNKAKRTLQSGRDRIRQRKANKSASKRSQSVPTQFTENDLIEGLRKANLLDNENNAVPKRYKPRPSDSSEISSHEEPFRPKPYRPIVQEYVAKRKQRRQCSSKVIELLDPKTAKVIGKITKGPPAPPIGFAGFLKIFRFFSILEIYRRYKAFKVENKLECRQIARLRNKCICDLMIIMIICGLGGIVFKNVEGAFENYYKCGVKRVKRDFIDILWYRSHNLREDEWKSLARNKLRTFEEELHTAHEAGMHSYSGQRSWSFLNGIIYCLTIVTTIGYGHIYPTTDTGRALTIVYAIIGIPLFLIALTDFGKLFTRCIKFLWAYVRRLYYTGSCRHVRKTTHVEDIFHGAQIMYEIATMRRPSMFTSVDPASLEEDPENPKTMDGSQLNSAQIGSDTPTTPAPSNFEIDDEFNLPISLAIFMLVLYIFLGAVMYCALEQEWRFFESFYFVFISMSTIGFGDMVPKNTLCMVASIVYLVFGLALMSMCINVVQVKLSDTFKDASSKLGATIGLSVNEEDGSISTVAPSPVEVPDIHLPVENEEEEHKDKDKKNGKNGIKKEKKSSMKVKNKDEDNKDEDENKVKTPKEVKF